MKQSLTKNRFLLNKWVTNRLSEKGKLQIPTRTHTNIHTQPRKYSADIVTFSLFFLMPQVVVAGTHYGKFPKPKLRNGFGVFFHNSGCHSPEPDIPILCLIKKWKKYAPQCAYCTSVHCIFLCWCNATQKRCNHVGDNLRKNCVKCWLIR